MKPAVFVDLFFFEAQTFLGYQLVWLSLWVISQEQFLVCHKKLPLPYQCYWIVRHKRVCELHVLSCELMVYNFDFCLSENRSLEILSLETHTLLS